MGPANRNDAQRSSASMSSSSDDGGAEDKFVERAGAPVNGHNGGNEDPGTNGAARAGGRIFELLQEERELPSTPTRIGNGIKRYRNTDQDAVFEQSSTDGLPIRPKSPAESLQSTPDDGPSVQGSVLSSPASSIRPSMASRPGLDSPTPSFRPFDRRFQSRLSSSSLSIPRASSPAFLRNHSRTTSVASVMPSDAGDTDTPSPPWEVVRWTKLKKLNGQAFSEVGKRNFGMPTCIAVSAYIVLGTSKGIILIFDYHQNLKSIIGPGTKGELGKSHVEMYRRLC